MFYATLLLWGTIYASSEKPSCLPNVSAQRHVFCSFNKSNSTSRSRFPRSHLPPFSVATAIVTMKSSLAFYMYIHRRRQDLKALIKKNSIHTAHGKDAGLMGRKGGKGRERRASWKGDLPADRWWSRAGEEEEGGIRPQWAQRPARVPGGRF